LPRMTFSTISNTLRALVGAMLVVPIAGLAAPTYPAICAVGRRNARRRARRAEGPRRAAIAAARPGQRAGRCDVVKTV
jgi:hypothetical protein